MYWLFICFFPCIRLCFKRWSYYCYNYTVVDKLCQPLSKNSWLKSVYKTLLQSWQHCNSGDPSERPASGKSSPPLTSRTLFRNAGGWSLGCILIQEVILRAKYAWQRSWVVRFWWGEFYLFKNVILVTYLQKENE